MSFKTDIFQAIKTETHGSVRFAKPKGKFQKAISVQRKILLVFPGGKFLVTFFSGKNQILKFYIGPLYGNLLE